MVLVASASMSQHLMPRDLVRALGSSWLSWIAMQALYASHASLLLPCMLFFYRRLRCIAPWAVGLLTVFGVEKLRRGWLLLLLHHVD